MNNKLIITISACILAAALIAFGAYQLGARSGQHSEPATADLIDPATGKRVLYWHDPMYPGQRFDKPGKSPFMDMQLVPVFADDAKAGGVSIDPRVQQRLGVRTAVVERKSLNEEITAVGNVEYNERDVAVVQARANGYIERLHVRTPLQSVTAGQALADLYVPEWVAAQEEFLAVQRMQSDARATLLEAAVQRMRLVGMSDQHIAEIEKTQKAQARLTVRAPIAGVVTSLDARDGMTVMSGAPLFRINGLSTVWVYAEVPEAQLNRVKVGTHVMGSATALPGTELHGSVLAVLPEVSSQTRTARARIELRNDKRLLTPGMFVSLRFVTPQAAPVLVVPSEAIIVTGERSVVIVAEGEGRFRPVVVTTGVEGEGLIEVTSGLQEGEAVVTSAQFLIDSEASLKGALERMGEVPSPELRSTSPGTGRGDSLPLPVPGEGGGEGHNHGAPK
jgi:Cu(I)/Ag(I) efflux system membrane fusion protein